MFFNSTEKYWQIPEQRGFKKKEADGNRWKQNETEQLSRSFKHFSQVYKIEEVDIEHLEPLSSINLEMHKVS